MIWSMVSNNERIIRNNIKLGPFSCQHQDKIQMDWKLRCKKVKGVSWQSSDLNSAFSLHWPKFNPWLGNQDPKSYAVWPKYINKNGKKKFF